MEHQHSFSKLCSVCGCNNPLLKVFQDELIKHIEQTPRENIQTTSLKPRNVIFIGGTIRPMINGDVGTVEALGISDGYVVAVGSKNEVEKYFNDNKAHQKIHKKVLQANQVLLPGFIEPHVHIVPTALMQGDAWVDLGPFDGQNLKTDYSFEEISKAISDNLSKNSNSYTNGKWFLGHTVDPALMPLATAASIDSQPKLQEINRQNLDDISNTVPIILCSASMHTLYLNTPALTAVYNCPANWRLKDSYKNLEIYCNKTNGLLQEDLQMKPAMIAILAMHGKEILQNIPSNIGKLFAHANSVGVTMMYDAGMNSIFKASLNRAMALYPRRMRVGGALAVETQKNVDDLHIYTSPEAYNPIYYSHVKIVSDGSNQGLTGYQFRPYCCEPNGNYGLFNFLDNPPQSPAQPPVESAPSAFTEIVSTVLKKGWPLMVHANGDTAVSYALQAFSSVDPSADVRHRIEHCSLLTPTTLGQMQQYGISPSFLIGHVGYWGYVFKNAIFLDKANQLDLCQSAISHGLRLTLHSDNAVTPLGPLRMMEQAITRIMEGAPDPSSESAVLMPSECLTPEQALKAITYDAAWQCNAENWFGSLQVGHFADMVILEQDPLTMGNSSKSNYENYYHKLRAIPVFQTWVGGEVVYRKHV